MDASTFGLLGVGGIGLSGAFTIARAACLEFRNNLTDEMAKLRTALWAAQRFDPMTGLPNRQALIEELTMRQAQGGSWALVRFDIDEFKKLNDSLGHSAGDLALEEFARRLLVATGTPEHAICARIHGDEFAMVVPYSAEIGAVVMERVAEAIAQPMQLGAVRREVTASIGLVDGDAETDPETLMHRADQAVYRSKRTHKPEIWRPRGAQTVSLPGCPDVVVDDLDAVPLVSAGGVR
ncbi:MAG: GGDEF domain-containing protein [Catenulispora sp.]|nr:GGDEF domain-containing protein [Catenulispora sp.]NUT39982.1 GGDEF domain-containing protein [Thermoactinospora sp.]